MIQYDPRHWARLLFSYRGTVLPGIRIRLLLLTLWALAVLMYDAHWHEVPRLDPLGHTLMGAVVAFLIVLRTNTAYERFWEGRKLWGGIVNSSRNLVREAEAFASPTRELAGYNAAYVLALKQFLRRETDFSEIQRLLSAQEYDRVRTQPNPPLAIAHLMSSWIQKRMTQGLDVVLGQHLDERIRELIDHQGACERILKTPIPFNYAVHIKQFLAIYLATLPFILVAKMGWLTVPMVLLIGFGMGGVEEAGVEVEDPFGTDPNDLPLEAICMTIERDVMALTETHPGQ